MSLFAWGACAMASATIVIFLLKFYRETGDRLFGWFAAAFVSLSLHWIGLAIAQPEEDMRHYFYLLRLLAFLLILAGIVDKNGPSSAKRDQTDKP